MLCDSECPAWTQLGRTPKHRAHLTSEIDALVFHKVCCTSDWIEFAIPRHRAPDLSVLRPTWVQHGAGLQAAEGRCIRWIHVVHLLNSFTWHGVGHTGWKHACVSQLDQHFLYTHHVIREAAFAAALSWVPK